MLREIGAPPAPKPIPESPTPLTPVEVLRHAGWPAVAVVDGQVTGGPRGYAITVLDKAARYACERVVWDAPIDACQRSTASVVLTGAGAVLVVIVVAVIAGSSWCVVRVVAIY